jgi:hypothetical protein
VQFHQGAGFLSERGIRIQPFAEKLSGKEECGKLPRNSERSAQTANTSGRKVEKKLAHWQIQKYFKVELGKSGLLYDFSLLIDYG